MRFRLKRRGAAPQKKPCAAPREAAAGFPQKPPLPPGSSAALGNPYYRCYARPRRGENDKKF